MQREDDVKRDHLRICQCGVTYNITAGNARFPSTFGMFAEFTIGSQAWYFEYSSATNETSFVSYHGDRYLEYEHKGYLSPKHFRVFRAFL